MGLYRSLADRAMTRLHRRDEYDSKPLRDYFASTYDIIVGDYSIGAFDRWRVPPGTRIGRYCSIARTARLLDANHPFDALSTHPYFYLRDFGVVADDRADLVPPVVEDDVWIGHNATITPACHTIGRGAIIGAGAVVMADVPPYAIMVGAPAKLVRFRFAPDVIALIEASRWWTLDKAALADAARAAPDFVFQPGRTSAADFFAKLGRTLPPPAAAAAPVVALTGGDHGAALTALLAAEIPAFTPAQLDTPFAELPIDSFALIGLRAAAEQLLGTQIGDRAWAAMVTPGDLVRLGGGGSAPVAVAAAVPQPSAPVETVSATVEQPAAERRTQVVNMPQMALRGLSESWLFKELGDIHWSVLTRGLGVASADVADTEGNRLYATFTRILLESTVPLTGYRENETLTLDLAARRYGAGMFFGDATLTSANGSATAHLMTSFSKFGESGANTSLLKGQPAIPPGCAIPDIGAAPPFAHEYRARRAADLAPPLFETRYDILPPHDINGVGLLYFAAYPMIADLCAMRHGGRNMLFDFSTIRRDVCYFANATPDETLVFKLHEWSADASAIHYEGSLSRASDGKTMAHIICDKVANLPR